jgi:5-methylthioribose kinase
MEYHALTEETVGPWVCQNVKSVPNPSTGWTATEVGDGNLNQVFILTDPATSGRIVVKQALPYLRVAGASWPLTRERMRFEVQALELQNSLVPGLVPRVYHQAAEMSLVVMECLDGYQVMRKPISEGKLFPKFASQIAEFMARTHFFTSDLYLAGEEKKALQIRFNNPELCRLQEDFVYTNPFMESPENGWNPCLDDEVKSIRNDAELKAVITETKIDYLTHAQVIVHGDLHTGSIMVKEDEIRIIDPEFSFCGPAAYDIGTLIANLLLAAFAHQVSVDSNPPRKACQEFLLRCVGDIWNQYTHLLIELWNSDGQGLMPGKFWATPAGPAGLEKVQKRFVAQLLKATAAHAGCEMLRRLMGIVSILELKNIQDDRRRALAEKLGMDVARILLQNEFNSIDQIVLTAREAIERTSGWCC